MVSPNPGHPKREIAHDVGATYENGVLRPDRKLDLEDRARVIISVRQADATGRDATAQASEPSTTQEEYRRRLERLFETVKLDLRGWTFNRDELYERD
jgi:predicted DNA-binding antitoxin AbrB/MazE fold protein